jgi:hypothetical protein
MARSMRRKNSTGFIRRLCDIEVLCRTDHYTGETPMLPFTGLFLKSVAIGGIGGQPIFFFAFSRVNSFFQPRYRPLLPFYGKVWGWTIKQLVRSVS